MSDALKKFEDAMNNPPTADSILNAFDDKPVRLNIQTEDGKAPFIYGRAYVYELLGEDIGWYVRDAEDDRQIGWKCVLMPQARRDFIAKGCPAVKSLKVVRPSESGKALLCEVNEYLEG